MEVTAESAMSPGLDSRFESPAHLATGAEGDQGLSEGEDMAHAEMVSAEANDVKPAKGPGSGDDELDFELGEEDDGEIEEGEAESDKEDRAAEKLPVTKT